MELHAAYKGARIIETIENYSVAEEAVLREEAKPINRSYFSDEEFWSSVFEDDKHLWGQRVSLHGFVISEWVARIPGLYWTKSSEILRTHNQTDIALQSREWIKFHPPGKSKKVLGGVGTLLLPPTDEGKILLSLSSSCNASTGVPLLLFPDVMDALKIEQGNYVNVIGARWQPMNIEWSQKFATSKEIPRGYLVIDEIKKMQVIDNNYPVIYHPFSIMEYEGSDALLYDFVYASADSQVKDVDRELEKFFDDYKNEGGRNGNYLLNPNITKPLFESRYSCPSELRHPSEKAKLNILFQRVRDAYFNEISISVIVNELPKYFQSSVSIRGLAARVGLNLALLSEDSAASMSAQLISLCLERDIMEKLIDRMIWEYPEIFKQ